MFLCNFVSSPFNLHFPRWNGSPNSTMRTTVQCAYPTRKHSMQTQPPTKRALTTKTHRPIIKVNSASAHLKTCGKPLAIGANTLNYASTHIHMPHFEWTQLSRRDMAHRNETFAKIKWSVFLPDKHETTFTRDVRHLRQNNNRSRASLHVLIMIKA